MKPSRGHIKQLKHQLKHWKKCTESIDEYHQVRTTRYDQLFIFGTIIEHEDHIDFILEGFSDDCKQDIDQLE